MAKQKYLVVSEDKGNSGCYKIFGWTYHKARGRYDLDGKPVKVILADHYLKDFGEWDMPLSQEHMKAILRSKKDEIEL